MISNTPKLGQAEREHNMTGFSHKVAIVTGGADGIGEAVARTLAARGASVVIADKDAERTSMVTQELRDAGGDALGIVMNVRDEQQVADMVQEVMQRFGRIDVLDNNAAAVELVPEDHDVANVSTHIFEETLRVNVMGPYFTCKHAIPHMVNNGGGSIINMSSISGLVAEPRHTAYGVSKSAVMQLTRLVAAQYGKVGIRCNSVAPGFVKTRNVQKYAPEAYVKIYERHSLTPYVGDPQDVANLVVFLASDESRYMSGQIVCADGGTVAGSPILADFRDLTIPNRTDEG
jgi:NAD(P)-dependent dehydrogenase (short-subunit alcohol dehydrogenase family)